APARAQGGRRGHGQGVARQPDGSARRGDPVALSLRSGRDLEGRRGEEGMLHFLIQLLGNDVVGINALRYTTSRTGAAMLTSLFLVFMFGPSLISVLRVKQGRGQPIRADGPQRHVVEKQGTPTMGGLMILVGIVVSTLLWADLANLYVWAVLFVMLGFGAIGFYDDFLKVTRSSSKGFPGRVRLACEIAIAAVAVYAFMRIGEPQLAGKLALPFFKDVLL